MAGPFIAPTGTHRTLRTAPLAAAIIAVLTLGVGAQTRIEPHSNSYTPEQDGELGRQAAQEVRQQLPVLNDQQTEAFVERIGRSLVDEIPDNLQQPAFRYSFDVVNLKE